MSLLMDALKKAEEAKEQVDSTSANEERIAALSDNGKKEIAKSEKMLDDLSLLHDSTSNLQEKVLEKNESAASELRLEPKESVEPESNLDSPMAVSDTIEKVPPSTIESSGGQSESAKLVQEIRNEKQPSELKNTPSGTANALANNSSTVRGQADSQRIFKVSPKRSARQPIVNLVFGLVFFSIFGSVAYYYYSGTVSDFQQVSVPFPSQTVEPDTEIVTDEIAVNEESVQFGGDETSELQVIEQAKIAVITDVADAVVEKNVAQTKLEDKLESQITAIEGPLEKSLVSKPKISQAKISESKDVTKHKPVSKAKQAPKSVIAQKPSAKVKQATKIPTKARANESVNIVRQAMDDPILSQLEKAYKFYQLGNFEYAKQTYQNVLSKEAGNRDARLGLAAIALQSGDLAQAHRHYKYLLRINPKDSVALSGVMSAITGANALKSESQVKLLLDQEPQAAHLHFTLGNLMAAQSRWSDAQQAYFQAYRFDPSNADYAFNLAVSLDYLGQQKTAVSYYKKSLELSKNRNVSFSAATVVKRINSLTGTYTTN